MLLESTPEQEQEDKAEDRALHGCEPAEEPCPSKNSRHAGERASKGLVPHARGTGPGTPGRQRKRPPMPLHPPAVPRVSVRWNNVPGRLADRVLSYLDGG